MGKSKLGPLIMGFCCCFKTHLWQTLIALVSLKLCLVAVKFWEKKVGISSWVL